MNDLLNKYGFCYTDTEVAAALQGLKAQAQALQTPEVYAACLGSIDLTALNATDTPASIIRMVEKVNAFAATDLARTTGAPNVPAICVYPALVPTVKAQLQAPGVQIAAVSAGFPASQTFLEVKVHETLACLRAGATEIDIVISLNHFLSDKPQALFHEVAAIKAAMDGYAAETGKPAHLKVILESGTLATAERIARASFLAMEAGADFIKTSTGKSSPAATPEAAWVMCRCIRLYAAKTGRKVGFKAAGGIGTAYEGVTYYAIVKEVLGENWLNPSLFRIGASRLANNLLSALAGTEQKYF